MNTVVDKIPYCPSACPWSSYKVIREWCKAGSIAAPQDVWKLRRCEVGICRRLAEGVSWQQWFPGVAPHPPPPSAPPTYRTGTGFGWLEQKLSLFVHAKNCILHLETRKNKQYGKNGAIPYFKKNTWETINEAMAVYIAKPEVQKRTASYKWSNVYKFYLHGTIKTHINL